MQLAPPFRPATPADADVLAELVNYAGEGMPLYLWEGMAQGGETAWDVGRKRAAREDGSFSYRNTALIEHESQVAGCLIGYAIPETSGPIPDDLPAMFVPLQELEDLAPATWYVNILAVMPQFRGRGLGAELLGLADATARSRGLTGTSLIVADANEAARRLYARCGYREAANRPMVKKGWVNPGRNWLLMVKAL